MNINENTTLRELIDILGTVEKAAKTPTSKKLRDEAGDPIAIAMDCIVYANGYGVYENETGRTVMWIPSCTAFTYHFDKLRESMKNTVSETITLPEGLLEGLPWFMAMTVVGDHRIEANAMNRRQGSRKGSKDYRSQDDGDKDGEAEEAIDSMDDPYEKEYSWREEGIGENPESIFIRKETRREMLESMTEKQRDVFTLYYQYGYTQKEIAETLGISKQSVHERLDAALKKVKRLF